MGPNIEGQQEPGLSGASSRVAVGVTPQRVRLLDAQVLCILAGCLPLIVIFCHLSRPLP